MPVGQGKSSAVDGSMDGVEAFGAAGDAAYNAALDSGSIEPPRVEVPVHLAR